MEKRTRGMANRTGRTMNSAMNISLPVELHEQLRDLAWQERKPLSHLCRDFLEAGIRQHEASQTADAEPAKVSSKRANGSI